jgi:chromosome segregation ATPase
MQVGQRREAPGSLPSQDRTIDQQLFAVDKRLYEIGRALASSRAKLYDTRRAVFTFEHAYDKERKENTEYAAAYSALHAQYMSILEIVRAKDREIEQYQHRLSKTVPDGNLTEADWNNIEHAISKKEELEAKLAEMEAEKSQMIQQHHKEKFEMVKEHQNALINAANRISAYEGKISELEEKVEGKVEGSFPVSPAGSLGATKRHFNEENTVQSPVPAKRGRRRKH